MDVPVREPGSANKKVLCIAEFNKSFSVITSASLQTVATHFGLHFTIVTANISVEVDKDYDYVALWIVFENTIKQ